MQSSHHLGAVVSAIGHDFLDAAFRVDPFHRDLGPRQRLRQRRRVSRIGRVDLRGHDHSADHIHRVLGLVRQMRRPVLHLRDPRVRVARTLPILVGDLLPFALAVHPPQVFRRRILDPLRPGQLLQVLLVRRPSARRTIVRIAALASSVVASMATFRPFSKPSSCATFRTQSKISRWISSGNLRLNPDNVEFRRRLRHP